MKLEKIVTLVSRHFILRFSTNFVSSVTSHICPNNAQHMVKLVENVESTTTSRLFAEASILIQEI